MMRLSGRSLMSDAELERKFTDLAQGVLPAGRIRQVMDLCWRVESLSSAAEIAAAGQVAA